MALESQSTHHATPYTRLFEDAPGIGNQRDAFARSTNAWMYCGFTWIISGGAGELHVYRRLERQTAFSHFSIEILNSTPTILSALCDRGTGAFVDGGGACSALKAWSGELTEEQHMLESTRKEPVITIGLVTYLPCTLGKTIGTADFGNNWTVIGTGLAHVAAEPHMTINDPIPTFSFGGSF